MQQSSVPHTPLVSVIIPNYNHAPFLRERIESVLSQELDDMEVILLDDCSTDSSRDIIDSYRGHPKVSHIVCNDNNSGSTFAQWKRGLAMACGKYVWIAESDDSADSSFLSTLVPLLESHPEAVMAYCGSHIIDAEGQVISGADWDRMDAKAPKVEVLDSKTMTRRNLLMNNGIYNASMAVFRRDAAPEIDARLTAMRFCGDWWFWSELIRRGSAIRVRERHNRFRQHALKVSPSASKEGLTYTEGFGVINRMANFLDLTHMQRKVLAGRTLKRLRRFPSLSPRCNAEIRSGFETLLGDDGWRNAKTLMTLYELDKWFNFSHLYD